jgi:hypothetical protein
VKPDFAIYSGLILNPFRIFSPLNLIPSQRQRKSCAAIDVKRISKVAYKPLKQLYRLNTALSAQLLTTQKNYER